jgi:hypothetical protein
MNFHLLIVCIIVTGAVANCPSYQFLKDVDLPSPLPQPILSALARVNASLVSFLNATSLPGFVASVWYAGSEVRSWGAGVADKTTGRAPGTNISVM